MKDYFSLIIEYVRNRTWLSHVLFWISILLIQTFGSTADYVQLNSIFGHKLIMLVPKMMAAYALIYYQVPKLLYKKKYLLFFISFALSSYLFSAIARVMVVHIVETLFRPQPFTQESISEIFGDLYKLYFHYYLGVYFPAILLFILMLVNESMEKRTVLEQLSKEKFSAELNFLKGQIHPHFLFNTLNNLYVLTMQKSEKAPETVLKLSEMLDYMLYQCNDKKVTVEKEMQLIQNYIDLESLRYGNRLQLDFEKEIDNSQTQIAPLILISIVENAFKHGASGTIAKTVIKIKVKVQDQKLSFEVFNTKSKLAQKDETNYKDGIGLKNTIKQLELIYPNQFQIQLNEEDTSYTVKLDVDLT